MTTRKVSGASRGPRTTKTKAVTGTALVPAEASRSLVQVTGDPMGEVVRDRHVTMVTGMTYVAHGIQIPAAEVFFDDEVKPKVSGPWLGEADKVAWRDPVTGYECIIMRDSFGGFLGGYVGVPASHPLYEFEHDAIPADIGIEVHGGVTYAAMCEEGPAPQRVPRYESRRICHVLVGYHPITDATGYKVEDAHAWWFGFTCDHIADVVPTDRSHASSGASVGIVQVYRNDAYVLQEVRNLAVQLRAIADGVPVPPRTGPPLPSNAHDRGRGHRS